MSNGVWVSSAWAAMRKITNPRNWVRISGKPSPFQPNRLPSCWKWTMPCRLIVPVWITTPTTASTRGSS